MVYVIFLFAAIITVLAAIELSNHADRLSDKTSMGGLMIGTLLLAGATSLPEVTTSLSAVFIANPDIAVGNMLGSNLFNLFIIAGFDLWYRKQKIYQLADSYHLHTALIGLVLSVMIVITLEKGSEFTFFGAGLGSYLILFIYIVGMMIVSKISDTENSSLTAPTQENNKQPNDLSVKKTILGFISAAIIIMFAGSLLSVSGDRISEITGLGSTFIGSFLMAATTSLPEAVAVLVALRLKNINLAIGSILGSNMFNMLIIVMTDFAYQNGSILIHVSPFHEITAAAIAMMSILIIYSLLHVKRSFYTIPSLLIVLCYCIASYFLYNG